jgi:hypothetical protein
MVYGLPLRRRRRDTAIYRGGIMNKKAAIAGLYAAVVASCKDSTEKDKRAAFHFFSSAMKTLGCTKLEEVEGVQYSLVVFKAIEVEGENNEEHSNKPRNL